MTLAHDEYIFLTRLLLDKPEQRSSTVAHTVSRNHYIGFSAGRHVRYRPADFKRVELLLRSHGMPVVAPPSGSPRSASIGAEKAGTAAPHADSVAFKPLCGACLLEGHPVYSPRGGYLVATAAAVSSIACRAVMLVENLETFRYLEDYSWLDRGSEPVLAVYRGDKLFSGTGLTAVIRQSPTLWYFGDFDPAGLGIAIGLDRDGKLERIIHPDPAWLESTARQRERADLYANQLPQHCAAIDASTRADVVMLRQILHRVRYGLPQEWMVEAKAADGGPATFPAPGETTER